MNDDQKVGSFGPPPEAESRLLDEVSAWVRQHGQTKVTNHSLKGWRKQIGFHIGKHGRRLPKRHYLGHIQREAQWYATILEVVWQRIRGDGRGVWEPSDLELAKTTWWLDLFLSDLVRAPIICEQEHVSHE